MTDRSDNIMEQARLLKKRGTDRLKNLVLQNDIIYVTLITYLRTGITRVVV